MFLHSAWIFHPEAHVAPINSTKPPSFQSAQLSLPPHRSWLASAGVLPLQLSLPRQLSFTELSAVWLAACQRLHTHPRLPLPSLCLGLNPPRDSERADMTSEPHCHTQGISAVDETVTSPTIARMSSVVTRQERFVGMVLMTATQPC